jgi:DinB superfamily
MSSSLSSQLIEAYLDGPVQLRRVVSDLSPQELKERPVPGRWSTLEVVCHLVDSEQVWCHRMKRVIAEEKPLVIGYDQTGFTASLAYDQHDLEEELVLLETMRRQMARILSGLAPQVWSRACVHSELGLLKLEQMVQAEVDHIPHHICHIGEKRQALGLAVNS